VNLSTAGLRLPANASIDLHLHTTFSDGRWTLDTLFDHLLAEGFTLAAVTDHDRVDTLATVQQQARMKCLPVLVAVEMTTTWHGEMTDLLCYGFDLNHPALGDLSRDLLRRQQENTRQVFSNLRKQNIVLPDDTLPTLLDTPLCRQPHALAALLQDSGYGIGDPSVGKLLMAAGLSFETSDPALVAEAAHLAGGVCLIAHPGRDDDGYRPFDAELLDQFRQEVSIDGLEVFYPKHTPARVEMFREYAHRNHLLISAGSDSHRQDNPPVKYRAESCCALLERVGVRIEERLWP
jgi:predicted metal-dependent phosphoesterase TrpH